jgi:hypothetical protein
VGLVKGSYICVHDEPTEFHSVEEPPVLSLNLMEIEWRLCKPLSNYCVKVVKIDGGTATVKILLKNR